MNDLAERLFETLFERGGFATNPQLRSALGISDQDDEAYWEAHRELVSAGKVTRARARGGAIRLVEPGRQETFVVEEERRREQQFYPPVEIALGEGFAKEYGYASGEFIVSICANRRSKSAGTWSVPDLTLYACQTLQHVPGKVLSLHSFEVKIKENVSVTSVFEALAHTRFTNFSHLVVVDSVEAWSEAKDGPYTHIYDECTRHGVGLIVGDGGESWANYEILVDSDYFTPDWGELDRFVGRSFSPEASNRIQRMIR